MVERLIRSYDFWNSRHRSVPRNRWIWEAAALGTLGLIAVYATAEIGNPWIVLIAVGVLAFLLLVPNLAAAAISRPVRLVRSLEWWQVLWIVMLLGGLVFRARTASEISQSPVDAFAVFRICCMLLISAFLFLRLTLWGTNWLKFLF